MGKRRRNGEATRQAVLRYITSYIDQNGYSPSRRDIADALQLGLPTVQNVLAALHEAGDISYFPGKARAISIRRD